MTKLFQLGMNEDWEEKKGKREAAKTSSFISGRATKRGGGE